MRLHYDVLNPSALTNFIILLHGLNMQTSDMVDHITPFADSHADTQIILVQAPKREVVIYRELEMPAWYRVMVDETMLYEERDTLDECRAAIHHIISERGIPVDRLIISGFSQGGAVALYVALTCRQRFMAAIGMCTYLPSHLFYQDNYEQKAIIVSARSDSVFTPLLVRLMVALYSRMFGRILHMEIEGGHAIDYAVLGNVYDHCINGML